MKKLRNLNLGIFIGLPILSLIPIFFGMNLLSLCLAIAILIVDIVLIREGVVKIKKITIPVLSSIFLIQFVNGVNYYPINWISFYPEIIPKMYIYIFFGLFIAWLVINVLVKLIKNFEMDWSEVFSFVPIVLMAFPLFLVINLWESQLIWLLAGFYILFLFIFVFLELAEEKIRFWNEEIEIGNFIFSYSVFSLLSALVSTFTQFWGLAAKLIIFALVLALISWLLFYWDKKRKAKKAKKAEEVRKVKKAEEARKAKEARILQNREWEKENEKRLQKRRKEILESLSGEDELDWEEIKSLFNEREITFDFFQKKPKFFEASSYKKTIIFDPSVVSFMLRSFSEFYVRMMDDEILEKTVDQFCLKIQTEMAYLKDYKGYDSLISLIRNNLELDLIKKISFNSKP